MYKWNIAVKIHKIYIWKVAMMSTWIGDSLFQACSKMRDQPLYWKCTYLKIYCSANITCSKYLGLLFLVLISLKQFSKVNFHYKIMFTRKKNMMEVISAKTCVKYGPNICLNFISQHPTLVRYFWKPLFNFIKCLVFSFFLFLFPATIFITS